jgi:hypothetical protein
MTLFFCLMNEANKAGALRDAVRNQRCVEMDASSFSHIPGSPFVYQASPQVLRQFSEKEALGTTRQVTVGLQSSDDTRFLRLWWETRADGTRMLFAKGGQFSLAYSDLALTILWGDNGKEVKAFAENTPGSTHWSRNIRSADSYFRPGLTWTPRTQVGLGVRVLPRDCVFGHKGPVVLDARDEPQALLATLAIMLSSVFRYLVDIQVAFGSYEVGVIQRTPVPNIDSPTEISLAILGRSAWLLARRFDSVVETSHAFLLPSALRSRHSAFDPQAIRSEFGKDLSKIDTAAFVLYGLNDADRLAITHWQRETPPTADDTDPVAPDQRTDDEGEENASGTEQNAAVSWLVGVAFGRFDPRLATGERAIPPELEPFDPLPSRSPGMYPEGEEPADRPDILVDDEGHADDLAARAITVAERVKVDVPENLRAWLAKEFFPLHIKMYSKSRRKAPIYWQLATPSASYSVWLYIHAFSKDTLFRVQNDYAAPKLAHEERRLESLTNELRDGATAAQRKQLAAQEALVEELRAFLDEVKRIAPLWNPNLDDGVIINFAPLWRLVPQNKAWQKELKSTWDAIADGKYDWAHLTMHLWPERVVPKCAKDRSLAIAHGLEDVFWVEGTDGKSTARKTPTKSVDDLVKERTSPAVKSTLKSLLEAPVASGKSTGRKGGGRRKAAADAKKGDA